jgi:ABC-type dipeptide/oligopeptide/nickel transport system ATPase subunit
LYDVNLNSNELQASIMKSCRIHLMGASGTGVTTLGRALADALAIPHHDTDDYFWQPPYRRIRTSGSGPSVFG